MQWLWALGVNRRRKSPFNNVDAGGQLSCGRVTPQLLVGGELGPHDWPQLQKAGVSAVINLQQEQQDIWATRERIEGYLWLPSPDGMAPSLAQLNQGVAFIDSSIRAGISVFVHCKAGQGRAPLLCACYLITLGATPLEAIAQVRQARPRTLLTPDQSVRLREFAAQHQEPVATLAASDEAPPALRSTSESNSNGSSKSGDSKSRAPVVKPTFRTR
jgi:protein-tyrosine phosphatase